MTEPALWAPFLNYDAQLQARSGSRSSADALWELGLLAPTVGINIFLASYRFKKPVMEVSRAVLPMQGVLLIGVLLITYFPPLTTWLPRWLGK